MSDRSSADFLELMLDTSGEQAVVVGHTNRSRGHRVIEAERPIASGPVRELTEEAVLAFLLEELGPFVER